MSEFAKKFDNYDYDKKPVTEQDVCVCVPVTIEPVVKVGDARVRRIGKVEVSSDCDCKGCNDTTCKFVISQKLRVEVPVDFDAKACPGEAYVNCDCDCKHDYDDCNDNW